MMDGMMRRQVSIPIGAYRWCSYYPLGRRINRRTHANGKWLESKFPHTSGFHPESAKGNTWLSKGPTDDDGWWYMIKRGNVHPDAAAIYPADWRADRRVHTHKRKFGWNLDLSCRRGRAGHAPDTPAFAGGNRDLEDTAGRDDRLAAVVGRIWWGPS